MTDTVLAATLHHRTGEGKALFAQVLCCPTYTTVQSAACRAFTVLSLTGLLFLHDRSVPTADEHRGKLIHPTEGVDVQEEVTTW